MQRKRSALGIGLQVYVDVVHVGKSVRVKLFLQVSRCTGTRCIGGKVFNDKNFEQMWKYGGKYSKYECMCMK